MFIFCYFDDFFSGLMPLNKNWLTSVGRVFASLFGDQFIIIERVAWNMGSVYFQVFCSICYFLLGVLLFPAIAMYN